MNPAQLIRCPCCGQEQRSIPRLDELAVALGLNGDIKKLFDILAASRGRFLRTRELADLMWDGAEGGPDQWQRELYVYISRLRALLTRYPIVQIEHLKGGGSTRLIARWAISRPVGGTGYELAPVPERVAA